jgi:hypothetical protein
MFLPCATRMASCGHSGHDFRHDRRPALHGSGIGDRGMSLPVGRCASLQEGEVSGSGVAASPRSECAQAAEMSQEVLNSERARSASSGTPSGAMAPLPLKGAVHWCPKAGDHCQRPRDQQHLCHYSSPEVSPFMACKLTSTRRSRTEPRTLACRPIASPTVRDVASADGTHASARLSRRSAPMCPASRGSDPPRALKDRPLRKGRPSGESWR